MTTPNFDTLLGMHKFYFESWKAHWMQGKVELEKSIEIYERGTQLKANCEINVCFATAWSTTPRRRAVSIGTGWKNGSYTSNLAWTGRSASQIATPSTSSPTMRPLASKNRNQPLKSGRNTS